MVKLLSCKADKIKQLPCSFLCDQSAHPNHAIPKRRYYPRSQHLYKASAVTKLDSEPVRFLRGSIHRKHSQQSKLAIRSKLVIRIQTSVKGLRVCTYQHSQHSSIAQQTHMLARQAIRQFRGALPPPLPLPPGGGPCCGCC